MIKSFIDIVNYSTQKPNLDMLQGPRYNKKKLFLIKSLTQLQRHKENQEY